jgi:hypothetical protein
VAKTKQPTNCGSQTLALQSMAKNQTCPQAVVASKGLACPLISYSTDSYDGLISRVVELRLFFSQLAKKILAKQSDKGGRQYGNRSAAEQAIQLDGLYQI